MKTWRCVNCGHEVLAKEKPNLKWADGHICSFMLEGRMLKPKKSYKELEKLAANYLAWQSEQDRMHKPCRDAYEALRDYVLEE